MTRAATSLRNTAQVRSGQQEATRAGAARGGVTGNRMPGSLDRRLLRRMTIFSDLEDEQLADLAGAAQLGMYTRGEQLGRIDELRDASLLVAQGAVRIYRLGADGWQAPLLTVPAGMGFSAALFAEHEQPISFAEAAVDGTAVFRIAQSRVDELLQAHPTLRALASEMLVALLRQAMCTIEDLTLHSVEARLARLLARLAAGDDGRMVWETHAELAVLVGTRQDEVTKRLRRLRERGLIAYRPHKRGIWVLAPEELASL